MTRGHIGLVAIPGVGIKFVDLCPPRFCSILPRRCPELLNSKTWAFSRIRLIISDDRDSGVPSKAPLVHLKQMGDAVKESLRELDSGPEKVNKMNA
jgi:hypothetical protein